MPRLEIHSERFAAGGGIGARATHRALGPRSLGFWELFLRETLQNSWDARKNDNGPISFGVHAWNASRTERWTLRDYILTDPPSHLGIEIALGLETLPLLAVCDGGTWGLSGPTAADVNPNSGFAGRSDFVDLIRDIGRRAVRGYGGGTYGFGKAVLTEASAVSTIVVYSRTTVGGRETSRLIAMAVGDDEYYADDIRYTGRHWWGLLSNGVADPLLDRDADATASTLGIGHLISGQTGTVILVIAPRDPDEDVPSGVESIMNAVADAAAEYAWPHMIHDGDSRPTIDFRFTLEGATVPVPDPMTEARLKMFVDAYKRCGELASGETTEGDKWPWCLRSLRSERPKRVLGSLAWRSYGPIAAISPDHELRSEIALIRAPRFVVRYMKVPRDPSGQSTAGVFLADLGVDRELAEAEPPSHDEWLPRKVRRADPARQIIKQIADELKRRLSTGPSPGGAAEPGVVSVASALGGFLAGGGDPRLPWQPQPPARSPGPADDPMPSRGAAAAPRDDGVASDGGGVSSEYGSNDIALDGSRPSNGGFQRNRDDTYGDRPRGSSSPAPRPRSYRNAAVRHDGTPRLLKLAGRRAVEFPFIVTKPETYKTVLVNARAEVLIDGGRETDPPAEADLPEVLQWQDQASGVTSRDRDLLVTEDGASHWSVIVSQPSDAAVTVSLSVIPGDHP